MSYNIGDRIGDYEIAGVLGAGGMGRVYKVRNVISDRIEAMKVLLPDLAGVPELADRFMREIKVLAGLEHPNIAALRTAQRIDNQLVMVMEMVEGQTLEDRLKSGPIPVPEAMEYVTQVLSALSYAHERRVIHRDIKPANMMVTEGGVVKLMDFGIAKAAGDRRLTQTGTTVGSLYYMSPEQIKGAELDARSDLYSLGVSLYEMVTGARPFRGESDFSIMSAHLEQQAVPPIEVDPKLPAALNEIIMMAIAKDPAQRFKSASAFQKALKSVSGSQAAPAVAAPPVVRAAPPAFTPPAPAQQAAAPPPAPPPYVPPGAQQAPPWPAQSPMPPPARSSHRGLYMALGAVLAIAVLILGATQLPKWLRTRAGENAATAQEAGTPQAAPSEQPPAAQPASGEPAAEAQPVPSGQSAAQPAPARPAAAPAIAPARQAQAGAAQSVAPPQPPPQQQAVPSQPSQAASTADAAKAAALKEVQKNWRMLASRAGAVSSSLQNLQQQQQRSGFGLRGDIAASWKRMEYDMDQLEAAISAKDPEAAKEHMENAEGEITNLEKFLGR